MKSLPETYAELMASIAEAAQCGDWREVREIFDSSPPETFRARACLYYLRASIIDMNLSSYCRAIEILNSLDVPDHLNVSIGGAISRAKFSEVPPNIRNAANKFMRNFLELNFPKKQPRAAIRSQKFQFDDILPAPQSDHIPRFQITLSGSRLLPREVLRTFECMRYDMEKWRPSGVAFELKEFNNVLVDRFGNVFEEVKSSAGNFNSPSSTIDNFSNVPALGTNFLLTDRTKGLYHWYVEKLPTLVLAIKAGLRPDCLLFGDHNELFQDDMVELLWSEAPQIVRISDPAEVAVLHVCRPSIRFLEGRRIHPILYDRIKESALRRSSAINFGARIYISRRLAQRRRMLNEEELEDRLRKEGFTPVLLEQFTVSEQISIVISASVIVAPHGAGLSHIVANRPGLSVFEIVPTNQDWSLRFNYARLSHLVGHRHCLWLEPANLLTEEWRVDIEPMMEALERFIASE